jgi:hypothetical protein
MIYNSFAKKKYKNAVAYLRVSGGNDLSDLRTFPAQKLIILDIFTYLLP